MPSSALRVFAITAICIAGAAASASAQDPIAQFYKGKTITVAIGSSTGGGLDLFGRLVQRHLGKHIPGNPTVVASNMPGAGGNIVGIHLYSIAPKDGTTIGIVFPSVIVEPLLSDTLRKNYDPSKFNYVGNANAEVLVCMIRNDAPVKAPADLLSTEVILGATAPGSTTADFPTMANGVLGTKFRITTGYKGSRDVTLAVERGEVQGICGLGWSTVKIQYPDVLKGQLFARIFLQEDLEGHPELNALGVPLMTSLARTEQARQALQMFYAQNAFSRPFILPPGVPEDRLRALRAAFMATMKDPELLAEAGKMNVDVGPSSGEELQALVARMYATPTPVVERIKKALGREK